MYKLKHTRMLGILALLSLSLLQCSSTKNVESESPVVIIDAYYSSWMAGVEGGGSGINVFIEVEDSSIKFDSIYFRNRSASLEVKALDKIFYIGRFNSPLNERKDRVMHLDSKEEYGNTFPEVIKPIPFKLEENECVLSYEENRKIKFFKITNLRRERSIPYPSAPVHKQ